MSRSAAKKYAKVLIKNSNKELVTEAKEYLLSISNLFKDEKFKDTVLSPILSLEEKSELLLGKECSNALLSNLIRLLIETNRIELIPYIYEELRLAGAVESNSFDGFVYSSEAVDSETMDELKTNISKKVDSKIDFKYVKSEDEGFRVEVPDLGIEVSFAQDRLKSQLIQHILRGI